MRTSTLSCLLAAFSSAYIVLANEVQAPVATRSLLLPSEELLLPPEPTPAPELVGEDEEMKLELRQATAINQGAVVGALQVPSITTQFLETVIAGGIHTWLPFVYTQTFAVVPDQWSSAVPGQIGYGNLKKDGKNGKRAEVAQPTGIETGIAGRIRA